MAMLSMLMLLSLGCPVEAVGTSRVRSEDADTHSLIAEGTARSATFRRLVAAFDETDTIVYVKPAVPRKGLRAFVSHTIVTRDESRYVFATVSAEGRRAARIALVGHELQHALEIARAPSAGRSESATDLFTRIGFRSHNPRDAYETQGAIDVQRAVITELQRQTEQACTSR